MSLPITLTVPSSQSLVKHVPRLECDCEGGFKGRLGKKCFLSYSPLSGHLCSFIFLRTELLRIMGSKKSWITKILKEWSLGGLVMKGASLLHPLFPAEIPGITYQSVTHSRKTMNKNPVTYWAVTTKTAVLSSYTNSPTQCILASSGGSNSSRKACWHQTILTGERRTLECPSEEQVWRTIEKGNPSNGQILGLAGVS